MRTNIEIDDKLMSDVLKATGLKEMLGTHMAIKSAGNFRALRKKGITLRKTAELIIATFCIEQKLPLLFSSLLFSSQTKILVPL